MSEISRPVSPITESDERCSIEWKSTNTPTELNTKDEIVANRHLSSLSIEIDESLDKHCTPIRLHFIRQTSTASSTDLLLPTQDLTRPVHTIFEQLGVWNIVVIVFGSLYAIFLLGFLWFLWGGHEEIPFWRWLVAQGYVQRTVTLCSAFLRIVIAVQSTLGVSMLAALIVETMGFRLKDSAFLSVQRAMGGLPFLLLEKRLFFGRAKTLSVLTILLSCTTIGGLFTSTALIADFELVSILGYPTDVPTLYSLRNVSTVGTEPVYSNYRPASYPAFAEYSSSMEPAFPNSDQGQVDDPGPSLRALLPLDADVRQNVGAYAGRGTLLNSHVICVKPIINDLTFTMMRDASGTSKPIINGSIALQALPGGIEFNQSPKSLIGWTDYAWGPDQSVNFSCQMTLPSSMATREWPISMCVAGNTLNGTNKGLYDSGRLPVLGTRATSLLDENVLFDPLSYVLVNYSGVLPQVYPSLPLPIISGTNWSEVTSDVPTWRKFQPSIYRNLTYVSLSYCFSHFAAIDAQISVNSSIPRVEPALLRGTGSTTLFDASDVLRQLGADGIKRSLNDRGILTLKKDDAWSSYTDTRTSLALDGSYGFGMQRNSFSPPRSGQLDNAYLFDYDPSSIGQTWGLCSNCLQGFNDGLTFGIHLTLSSIFQTSLRASGSLATALEALFTVVNMMQYYDRLPQFDIAASASISTFTPTIQPKHRLGLLLVTIGMLIHIATIMAITVLFHFRTKNSFIGQSWHAVAQLQNENAIPILEKASLMRDKEVETMMREDGIDGNEVFFIGGAVEVDDKGDEKSSLRRRTREVSGDAEV
ncbi:uncharacterized protein PAC_17371 [Phialocephala subalpina]|uniref:Uncharacterized protein n=1 Tax=Phialocephala subalpina TaxID=576137 RepID=A0A1L7XQZ0_9HELO|nr:uncharacterized protein PAC_17371 [Phialocephala subalpina]